MAYLKIMNWNSRCHYFGCEECNANDHQQLPVNGTGHDECCCPAIMEKNITVRLMLQSAPIIRAGTLKSKQQQQTDFEFFGMLHDVCDRRRDTERANTEMSLLESHPGSDLLADKHRGNTSGHVDEANKLPLDENISELTLPTRGESTSPWCDASADMK